MPHTITLIYYGKQGHLKMKSYLLNAGHNHARTTSDPPDNYMEQQITYNYST